MYLVIDLLICCIFSYSLCLFSRLLLHYLQLESYQLPGYVKTIKRQWKKSWLPSAIASFFFCICGFTLKTGLLFDEEQIWIRLVLALVSTGIGYLAHRYYKTIKAKKKFVVTTRIKRLYVFMFIFVFALTVVLGSIIPFAFGMTIQWFVLPLLIIVTCLIAMPTEKLIYELYFRNARKKLLQSDLIRIGITGSFGKTSVKFILNTILSQKYQVLTTPSSYNTPMGITRIIREQLEPTHQIFIAEMGARHTKDIRELCRLVHPEIGILTSVGAQHLDTFKTLERIQNTKYDLIRALPEDGFAVFNNDGSILLKLYNDTRLPSKAITGGINDDIWASEITLSPSGSSFEIHFKEEDRILQCQTKLLGEHNIRNILLAVAVARHLNLSDRQIIRGIASLTPVEHRLQLIEQPNGVTVIDDAFNSSPAGSAVAFNVLAGFPGRHIVVTPGLVELGKDEEKYNYEFGINLAKCADVAILVGDSHTKPVKDALIHEEFDIKCIYSVRSLNEAVQILGTVKQAGDVILYENDLPDNYNEG